MDGESTMISNIEASVQELTAQTVIGTQGIELITLDGNTTIISNTMAGVNELLAQTERGKHDIESVTMDDNNTFISNTEAGVYELTAQTVRGKQDTESVIMDGTSTIISNTEASVHELTAQTVTGKQDIESAIMDGTDTIISNTEAGVHELSAQTVRGKQDIESAIMDGTDAIISNTKAGVHGLTAQTLRGKHDIESAIMDVTSTIISNTEASVHELTAQTVTGKQDIESAIMDGTDTIISNTETGVHELIAQTVTGKQDIESAIMDGTDIIISNTVAGVHELTAQTVTGKQDIESAIMDGTDTIISNTEAGVHELSAQTVRGKQDIESVIMDGNHTIISNTEAGMHELSAHTDRGKHDIDSVIMDGSNIIISNTMAGVGELKAQIARGKDDIQSDLKAVKEEILAQADVVKREIRDIKTNGDEEIYYSQRKEMLLAKMIEHYDTTLSNMKTSPLNDWVQARVDDIYMAPNLQLMARDKGSFKTTGTQVTKYSDVFLKDGKNNSNMFIQGEAGSGKSTFLAILVMDWCRINTAKSVERIQTDKTNTVDANARMARSDFFEDLKTLKQYTFIFHVSLRDSVNEFNILEMLKKQIIDSIYGDKHTREDAYKLLNEIMKRERCLVLLDALDEWTGLEGHILPEIAVSHSQCDALITTRPWKLTEANVPYHKISTLWQLEGVNEPFEVSKRLLGCGDDCKDSTDLDKKQSKFESYVLKNDLSKLLISPMLLQLIVQSWVEGKDINGSKCEIYSLFLESLLKKANKKKRKFQSPPFRCFTDTEYIQPNIENVDRLAEAAFHLLFSNTRESSLVFSSTDLERFELYEGERKEFALKSGILSATRKASALRSSSLFSFIHKSVQEFLAAYYIALNNHLITDIISGYLHCYEDGYLDISQVFIFLCGLEISAANKLSSMMNERDVDLDLVDLNNEFPNIILSGYREAVANKHSDINLKLSHFEFWNRNSSVSARTEIRDIHGIWTNNASNVLSLNILTYLDERGESASHYEFDLSSCSKLKSLKVHGGLIWLKDSDCSDSSERPVWIVLNNCVQPLPVLPSIERIHLSDVRCSPTGLHSLLSTLLTLDHEVNFWLTRCKITSCVEGSDTATSVIITTGLNNTLTMDGITQDSRGLWEVLHGLNIKSLSLNCWWTSKQGNHEESLLQSISSLTQLETLTMNVCTGIVIQPPKSLNYLNVYFQTLPPSKFRELLDTLQACSQNIESRLEFGCAEVNYADNNHDEKRIHQIAPEEYISIKQQLKTRTNVAVKQFRILDRIRATTVYNNEHSCWSVRSIGGVNDDNKDDDNVKDVPYKTFVSSVDNKIINRISMRIMITPASKTGVINKYGCNT